MKHAAPPEALVNALRRVLRPLVRLMVAKGITYPYLAELVKGVFVEVAENDYRVGVKAQTDSRISVLSGVHRKDVRRLRQVSQEPKQSIPAVVSLGAQLVAEWTGSPRYLSAEGRPLPLPRLGGAPGEPSFETLVAGVSKDVRSRAVLDQWLQLGVVHLDDENRVVLNTEAFVPQKGFDEMMFYFGHNLHDHACAAAHNVMGEGVPFLERSVHYDSLSESSVEELAKFAERAGMQAALAVNRKANELESQDVGNSEPKQRITFGIFYYSAPAEGSSGGSHD